MGNMGNHHRAACQRAPELAPLEFPVPQLLLNFHSIPDPPFMVVGEYKQLSRYFSAILSTLK